MKFLIMAIGTLFVGFVAWLTWPGTNDPTLFDLPPAEAYKRLTSVDFPPGNDAPFGRLEATATGDGSENVVWAASGSHAAVNCNIRLAPEENGAKTRVGLDCGGGGAGNGAANGMFLNMMKGRVIGYVDATLKGYTYDPTRVGQVASKWPGIETDPAKAYGQMTGEALKMQSDMMREQAEYERSKSAN